MQRETRQQKFAANKLRDRQKSRKHKIRRGKRRNRNMENNLRGNKIYAENRIKTKTRTAPDKNAEEKSHVRKKYENKYAAMK
jgi:hypothetical protein